MLVENIMKVIIIVLLTIKEALFELNSNKNINKRLIANGTEYDASKYPYVVFLTIGQTLCTGSLIHKLYVLTAAHCCYGRDASIFKVYQGSMITNPDFRRTVEVHVHKDYDPEAEAVQGDITVLKIERSFPDVKKYIQIGGKPANFANNKALKCIEIGFGVQNEQNKLGTKGYMITTNVRYGRTVCKDYDTDFVVNNWQQYLCSEPTTPKYLKSTCPGDSGGPMICNDLLYGISSFTYNYGNDDGKKHLSYCNVSNGQSVHTFINYFEDWVKDKVKGIEDVNEGKKKDEDKDEKEKKEEKKEKKKKEKKKKEKKKKRKKKSSGNSIKPHNTFHKVLTILLYCMLTKI